MAGQGHWTQQLVYRNCGNCPKCKGNKKEKPHGPYSQLRRRNPLSAGRDGKQDDVYLGKRILTESQLQLVNQRFSGPGVPTREEVIEYLSMVGGQ